MHLFFMSAKQVHFKSVWKWPGTFIKLYIPSMFCYFCPSKVTFCSCSSSAIDFDLVTHSGLQLSSHTLLKSLHSHCIHIQLNPGKASAPCFVSGQSSQVPGAVGRTGGSPQSLGGEVWDTWKSSGWPHQDESAGRGSGSSWTSSSASPRSLECGDIMGSSAKWRTKVTFCCLVNLVCRNPSTLCVTAFRCFQRALGVSFGEFQVFPPWDIFLRSHLIFLICCPWFAACDFQPGFFERSGNRGKTNLTTFSSTIIEV